MSCPPDRNRGLVQLIGGTIPTSDLMNPPHGPNGSGIRVDTYPFSISFSPRTTFPSLIGNTIDESNGNTCTYRANRFTMVDVQITSVIHKGYNLPGKIEEPVAELVLSYHANTSASGLAGILICVPIYDSGSSRHDAYLNQLIDDSLAACNYTKQSGYQFTASSQDTVIGNATWNSCVKTCCNDPSCLAYMYGNGQCTMTASDASIVQGSGQYTTGKIDRANPKTCSGSTKTKTSLVPTLESIFYENDSDNTQTSIGYKTCFETIDSRKQRSSHSLYVVVFPNGIHMTSPNYQQLLMQLGQKLIPYQLHASIRGGDATVLPTSTSEKGYLYLSQLSTCTEDFKHRFEYFTEPPKRSNQARKVEGFTNQSPPTCSTIPNYKCVPLSQLSDPNSHISLNNCNTLKQTINAGENQNGTSGSTNVSSGSTAIDWKEFAIIAGSVIGGLIFILNLVRLVMFFMSEDERGGEGAGWIIFGCVVGASILGGAIWLCVNSLS